MRYSPINYLNYALLIFTVLTISLLSYWAIEPVPLFRYSREIINPAFAVHAGENLIIRIDNEWDRACLNKVYRVVIDSSKVKTEYAVDLQKNPPGRRIFDIVLAIPITAAPGDAIYRSYGLLQCNPLQRVFPKEVVGSDLHFTILPPKG